MPETIAISTRELFYFMSIACPSFFLGTVAGILLQAANLKSTGHKLRWDRQRKCMFLEKIV